MCQDILLTKGAKHAMKRLEDVQQRHREAGQARKAAEGTAATLKEKEQTQQAPVAAVVGVGLETDQASGGPLSNAPGQGATSRSSPASPDPTELVAAALVAAEAQQRLLEQQKRQEHEQEQRQAERDKREQGLAENRTAAIKKATVGGAVLVVAVILRKAIFKV